MINKELLSEVLGLHVVGFYEHVSSEHIGYNWDESCGLENPIIISSDICVYELMHRMKEWALDKGFQINSCIGWCSVFFNDTFEPYLIQHQDNTEFEAVVYACQWIYDEQCSN